METAKLELINPYSKYGLKRRPTYAEIAGLIYENQELVGQLPDRDATFFKNTPQGSFFDGMDNMEILKEQQNRINNRQMRDLVLRQQASQGGTYNLHRHQQTTDISEDFQDATSEADNRMSDMNNHEAGLRARIEEAQRSRRQRINQTKSSHRGTLQQTFVAEGMINRRPQNFSMSDDEEMPELEDF